MHFNLALVAAIAAFAPSTMACVGKSNMPKATDTKSKNTFIEVKAGETYDGKYVRFDRGSGACKPGEGGQADAVFVVRAGGTLKNAIIGKNQKEGVHCDGACTLQNVWFEDVCEDAISIKNDKAGSVTNIIGGGAFHGEDKIVQHNGCGQVNIKNFYVEDYGKLYRSCGNCKTQCKRSVHVEGVTAKNGGELIGINSNLGDKATYSNNCFDTKNQCVTYNGCAGGCEPKKVGLC
ncbi:pectate lyase F [Ilyonectria sp. MPI-CAGE-AT-0026]|nr:pectate lyase F [Ilyonectria sp. MPI-CAGE-AT-0026]